LFFHEEGCEICNDGRKSEEKHILQLKGSIEIIACCQQDSPPESARRKIIDADNDEKKDEEGK
jgi:hypothetical protein